MFGFSRSSKSDQPTRRQPGDAARRLERASADDLNARYTFRRSYTITGSASSEVSTLGENKAQLKSSRVHAHDLTYHRRRLFGSLGVVLVASAVLYTLVSQFTATPKIIINGDESIVAKADYQAAVQDYFGTSPIERLRFMANIQHLTTYLQARHPEIEKVSDDGSGGFGVSRFAVTMRQPVVSWTIDGAEKYVDQSGVAYAIIYEPRPSVKIIDQSGVQIKGTQTLASDRFLSFVGQVVGLSSSLGGLKVTDVTIPSGMTRAIEVGVEGVSYPVKLSTDRPVGQQVEDMTRAIAWMQQHGVTPQYIDLRVSRDAFYLPR